MKSSKALRRLLVSVAITLVLAVLFLAFVPVTELLEGLSGFQVAWVFLPLFLLGVVGNIFVRGELLALLVNTPEHVAPSRWLAVSATHNLSTSLSGMIFGDAILFWLLNRFDIHWKKSLFTTLLVRVFEVSPLLLFLFLGLAATRTQLPFQDLLAAVVGVGFVVSLGLLFYLDEFLRRLPRWLYLGQAEKVTRVREAYREITARCMRPLLLYSFVKIALSVLYFFFVFRLFSVQLDFWQVCLVFGIFNFATALPVQGVAGLGTFEAYLAAGLILLGWASAPALALAFLVHMLFLASFTLIAGLSLLPILPAARQASSQTSD